MCVPACVGAQTVVATDGDVSGRDFIVFRRPAKLDILGRVAAPRHLLDASLTGYLAAGLLLTTGWACIFD